MNATQVIERLNEQYDSISVRLFWESKETVNGVVDYRINANKIVKYSFLHEALMMSDDIRHLLPEIPDNKVDTLLEDLYNYDLEYDAPMWTEWDKVEAMLRDYLSELQTEDNTSDTSKFVGCIDWYLCNGELDCRHEYTDAAVFEAAIREENYCGAPMGVIVYKDENGKTIPYDFVFQMDPPPLYFRIEARKEKE